MDQVILKEQKSVKEQIDTCPEERQDLKAEYQFRYDVISVCSSRMDADEVRHIYLEKFSEELATKSHHEGCHG